MWRRVGMGCLDAKEGRRVPGVDLKAESKRKTKWGVWKKNGVSMLWGRHSGGKKEERAPCVALINSTDNNSN